MDNGLFVIGILVGVMLVLTKTCDVGFKEGVDHVCQSEYGTNSKWDAKTQTCMDTLVVPRERKVKP